MNSVTSSSRTRRNVRSPTKVIPVKMTLTVQARRQEDGCTVARTSLLGKWALIIGLGTHRRRSTNSFWTRDVFVCSSFLNLPLLHCQGVGSIWDPVFEIECFFPRLPATKIKITACIVPCWFVLHLLFRYPLALDLAYRSRRPAVKSWAGC